MSRKAPVIATAIARICVDCGRVALDVRVERDGYVRCFEGVGCRGRSYRARQILGAA
jgi:hypothetical protein